ncbi:hypothetical protein Q0Z83_037870 [Actinoplanes sichuanensis]|uniref:Hemerythrin HHE cation binding domain-containing protein n=1 Tax=Actinoplanes sichuanensis TaxID=512349 RepID=A0ABW4A455_9ACTN|nr:hypothetical protein [Actinoplanes sichuanensis]BEL05596.1 hypothetical protein Q0Z83_037870 [Actinoplanes sichuanensis]
MSYTDVIDRMLEQHDEVRRLCAGVERSAGPEQERRFAELTHLVHLHERSTQTVVRPATRNLSATGDTVGAARLLEGAAIERSLTSLRDVQIMDAA